MVVFAVLYMCFEYLPATIVLAKGLMLGGLSKRRQVFEVASKSASDGPETRRKHFSWLKPSAAAAQAKVWFIQTLF